MSDIYDYAYIHVMRHPVDINKYTTAPKEAQTENEVNASDFSPRDLQIFVDSLETISRLEQAKQARRERRKCKKSAPSTKRMVTCLDSSVVGTSADEDAASLFTSSESDYIYDETYFGMSSVGPSSTQYTNVTTDTIRSSDEATSDSEESGVFLNNTTDSHLYENIDPIRPRSKVISHAKGKSLKSRLIALIMKKQYVQPAKPSVEMLSSTTIGEETEETQIYDRVLNDVIHKQFAKNPKKGKNKYSDAKKGNQTGTTNAEEKFLDKAMRFLTL